MLRCSN